MEYVAWLQKPSGQESGSSSESYAISQAAFNNHE